MSSCVCPQQGVELIVLVSIGYESVFRLGAVKEPVQDGGVCRDHCPSDKSKDEHVHIQLRSVFGLCSCLVHQRMRTAAFSSSTHGQICDNDQW